MLDIKSRSSHKKGILYIILSVLIPAAVMLASYPIFQQRAREKIKRDETAKKTENYENYFGTSYIYDIYQSGYVLYEDLAKKNAKEPVSEKDIFLPDVNWENLNANETEYFQNILSEVMGNYREGFLDFTETAEYYALDAGTGSMESNIAENRTRVEAYLKNEAGEEEISGKYDAWICLKYGESGDLSVEGYHGLDANLFLRKSQEYQHSNDIEEQYGEPALELKSPRNMVVFYGMNGSASYIEWENWYRMYRYYLDSGVVLLYVLLLALVAICAIWFRKKEKYELSSSRFFRIPLEITAAGVIIAFSVTGSLAEMMVSYMEGHLMPPVNFWGGIMNLAVWALVFFLWFWEIGCLAPAFGKGILGYIKEYSLLYRVFPFRKNRVFPAIKRQWKRFLHYLGDVDLTEHMEKSIWKVVLVNGAVVAILCTMWFGGIVGVVIYSIFLFFWLRKYFTGVRRQYQFLLTWVRKLSEGNLNAQMEGDAGIFEPLQEELCHIQSGFKDAVEEEVKSQKMKAELITNVSHDLKTPLTAIITYVDLLKREDLTPAQRAEYVAILDKKSMRLKVLIEDLFEISKATSNNVKLNITDVDIVNLIKQVRFEMEDKIAISGLDFRWNLPEEKILLSLDSQKTYRVFENLLGNILKYALKGSRVYIDLKKEPQGKTVITMKNISATELNFDPKEITERFVRGDLSRNTEGSGLGLAIARSFVELQGGRLDIEIDGDLFKAKVEFA